MGEPTSPPTPARPPESNRVVRHAAGSPPAAPGASATGVGAPATGEGAPPATPAQPIPPTDPGFWPAVVGACASSRRVRLALEGSAVVERTDAGVTVRVAPAMVGTARASLDEIVQAASRVAGRAVAVALVAPEASVAEAKPLAPPTEHPLVKQAMELFGARVVSVQARRERSDG